ncbi:ketoacyl-ACP synthase III [Enterococcus sp. MJM12]|uniref:Beta-ketoacyl-[acyl-carrier-protein] synthase III n=1 Tax=Candidatus Enterococcus myersii TaxID=2815322 RepID=A0ABS3H8X9_9ENTE|nr:beta-ketoacyl-ACP synthase III [Enterococcus sp. MJM12]MBO0449917.1 ketoacyl-ACP synthase III [Enterococcus sp. MJM12]
MRKYGKITATASFVPPQIIKNDDLAKIMDTSDEWIKSRTGILERRIATSENTSDLCIGVAEKLLAKSKVAADELDFIIVATMTPDYATPSVACIVQGAIAARNALAFDLSAACSGFVYALSLAEKLLQTTAQKGLVIGGEVLSKSIDWQDRTTAVLFGDGAAGVLLETSMLPMINKEKLQADGTRGAALTSGYVENGSPFAAEKGQASPYLQMEGREIFDFATRDVVKAIDNLVAEDKDEIDFYLLHQANSRILDKVARKLKVPRERFLQNMDKYGNTSGASIPLLLDEAVTDGIIRLDGTQKLVFSGFGGGLTWGVIQVTL